MPPPVPAVGASGAATFVLSLQPGATVGYAWSTDIFRSYSGNEQRSSPFPLPRQRFEGNAFLLDAGSRDVRGVLQRAAAAGARFLLALPYEEVLLTADAVGTVVFVASTVQLDWALPGQRCVVIGNDGTTLSVVVQSTTSSTIALRVVDAAGRFAAVQTLGSPGLAGGRVLPLVQVLLDPQQAFARYPVAVDLWALRATATVFGWAGRDSMGRGASVVTYTLGAAVPVTRITDDDLLIWDRPNAIDGTATEAMLSGAESLDLGALIQGFGSQAVPDWARPIRFSSSSRDDWQWFKAFIRLCRGRQRAFLLPTGREDLQFISKTAAGLVVASAAVAGGGDYVAWFASLAHQRLAVATTAGAVQYVTVTGLVDNGDGTLSLTLDAGVVGVVERISLLEQVRLEDADDNISVAWDGGTFSLELTARAVQETVVPPSAFLFDTVLETGILSLPITPAKVVGGELGNVTLINWSSDRTLSCGGIAAAGGNVDGMVVCLCDVNANTFAMTLIHEDRDAPIEARMHLPGGANLAGVHLAVWLVYSGSQQRWITVMSNT